MDRKILPFELKLAADATAGSFEGYGAVFGNIDSYGDMIVPGAFKKTLAAWKKQKRLPKMMLQHGGWGNSIEDYLPIGLWTDMREDEKGLWCEGVFAETSLGQDVRKLCNMEPRPALDGLSIGYYAKTVVYGTKPEEPRRTLKEIDLEEVSIVTFPANDQALIAAVKSARDLTIREFEAALERGTLPALSSNDAKKLLSGGFKALTAARDAGDDEAAELARRFRVLRGA